MSRLFPFARSSGAVDLPSDSTVTNTFASLLREHTSALSVQVRAANASVVSAATRALPDRPAGANADEDLVCALCTSNRKRLLLECGDCFCVSCLVQWHDTCAAAGKETTCPNCRAVPTAEAVDMEAG